jgi:hypothetical protein
MKASQSHVRRSGAARQSAKSDSILAQKIHEKPITVCLIAHPAEMNNTRPIQIRSPNTLMKTNFRWSSRFALGQLGVRMGLRFDKSVPRAGSIPGRDE